MKKIISSFFVFIFVLALISLSALLNPVEVSAQDCGGPVPPAPAKVWTRSGPDNGEVTLYWTESAYANRYAVAYGVKSNHYLYGADNMGGQKSRQYTVKSLQPGQKYYFRLAAAAGCTSSGFSSEVSAVASGVASDMLNQTTQQVQKPITQSSQSLFSVHSGPRVGEVTLNYANTENADNYHLVYGIKPGKFLYGALNIGKGPMYTVKSLVPGKSYYFALVPVKGDRAGTTTGQVMALAQSVQKIQVVETDISSIIQQPPSPGNTDGSTLGAEDQI